MIKGMVKELAGLGFHEHKRKEPGEVHREKYG